MHNGDGLYHKIRELKNEYQFSVSIWEDTFLDQAGSFLYGEECIRETGRNMMSRSSWKYPKTDIYYYMRILI